jgi:4'-phosphopantetheinyl transferase
MNVMHLSVHPSDATVVPLHEGWVHLWTGCIDDYRADLTRYEAMLSADERARMLRFMFVEHQQHYAITRGLLRQILSLYAGRSPHELVFTYSECGKPYVVCAPSFNVSHSGNQFVCAVTPTHPIGVDIERVNHLEHMLNIARTCLTERELCHLLALPTALQRQTFYTYWTCKEAILKAQGCGLSVPMTSIEISLEGSPSPILWTFNHSRADTENWWLQSYTFEREYRASVALDSAPG